jgi:PTH1 family peptidyl-tRNA hydrolase
LKLIVGLGNPGKRYFYTRHNAGFMVIDKLAMFFKIKSFKTDTNYQAAPVKYKEQQVILMKPLTFMNLSGIALKEFTDQFSISFGDILVIYDDVNLDFGTIRIRPSGSDGGQKGMHSIIYELQDENIPRLRIGIRNPAELEKFSIGGKHDLTDYVLSEFTPGEMKNLSSILEAARDSVLSFIENDDIKVTMNTFNRNFISEDNSQEDNPESNKFNT